MPDRDLALLIKWVDRLELTQGSIAKQTHKIDVRVARLEVKLIMMAAGISIVISTGCAFLVKWMAG